MLYWVYEYLFVGTYQTNTGKSFNFDLISNENLNISNGILNGEGEKEKMSS